jgi:hypothetical protein
MRAQTPIPVGISRTLVPELGRIEWMGAPFDQPGIRIMTGKRHYEPLSLTRLQRSPNKHGYRWFGYYNLPGSLGGKEISVRHHQNADDDNRGMNRTENFRPIPESSPDFARLRVLRPDAESINRGIEDSLFRCRARLPVEAAA